MAMLILTVKILTTFMIDFAINLTVIIVNTSYVLVCNYVAIAVVECM